MPVFRIRGVDVDFPFQPYPIQRDYMEKVVECLENQQNAVLESPTGTGKTLSLLCSSLGWLKAKKDLYKKLNCMDDEFSDGSIEDGDCLGGSGKLLRKLPTIFYTSRTHSQLTQAMQELKRTEYRDVKAVVLGSREQMCINPDVQKLEDNISKIHLCQSFVKTRSCSMYNRVDNVKNKVIAETTVVDIEDLIGIGKKFGCCPYFISKELKDFADIVFMPYNYLIASKSRSAAGISLKDSVIIIDEAHNIERLCEESASTQIRTNEIAIAIREVTQLMELFPMLNDVQGAKKELTQEDLFEVKTILIMFEQNLNSLPIDDQKRENTFGGNYICGFLEKAGINSNTMSKLINQLELMTNLLSVTTDNVNQLKGTGLQSFLDFLIIIKFSTSGKTKTKDNLNDCFKVHVRFEKLPTDLSQGGWLSQQTTKEIKVLNYWCFSPGFGMHMLLRNEVRSVILTSGTLAPLKPLINELQIDASVQLENDHVISNNQIFIKIINKGPDGELFSSSFANRDNIKYIKSLGTAISNYSRVIPGGLLVFFPSYSTLNTCTDHWKSSGMWAAIDQKKKIFSETKSKKSFEANISDYYKVIKNDKNGAIFMGVCRGKVSEGLDFADVNGRAVIITGLPYPPLMDPRVILKKQYLDNCGKNRKVISGSEWYSLEAIRAVNQAIGRVIRHKNDFGAILLMDSRFNNPAIISKLSKWLRDKIVPAKSYSESIRDLKLFFDNVPKLEDSKTFQSSTFLTPESFPNDEDANVSTHFKNENSTNLRKKKRFKVELRDINDENSSDGTTTDSKQYFESAKKFLDRQSYDLLIDSFEEYRFNEEISNLIRSLDDIFQKKAKVRFLIQGLTPLVHDCHKIIFSDFCEKMK